MTKKTDPKPMSELRRKRMAEVAGAGAAPVTKKQFEALGKWIAEQPGHQEAIAESDTAFSEILKKKAAEENELRRRNRSGGDKAS